jgi:hypothetical protein
VGPRPPARPGAGAGVRRRPGSDPWRLGAGDAC